MIRLEVLSGIESGKVVTSELDSVRIGRAEACELAVAEFHVSGEHARVLFGGAEYIVRDQRSTNGTRLLRGDDRVDLALEPGREAPVLDGDVLELGDREEPLRVRVTFPDDQDSTRIVSVRHVAEIEQVEAKVGSNGKLLQKLYQAQKVISGGLLVDEVLDAVASQVFSFLSRATHVTVALREEDESKKRRPSYVPVGTRVRGDHSVGEPVPITRSVFRKVVKERAAVLAADAKRDVGETASLMAAQILSTIGVPLWIGDEMIGVLQVDNRASKGIFKEDDLDTLAVLAQTTSQAFHHARLFQRLKLAEERARTENTYLKSRDKQKRFSGIIGDAPAMRAVLEQLRKVVETRVTVFVEGETGTGKELIASAVHHWSNRADKLFVAQNCAALPENLLESELFGHRKGSFTGATEDKKGLFVLADGGTLFLDEVGEMPMSLQAKLLRVLQEGEVRPVGASAVRKVDVRIVAATNRDLEKEVAEGRFREDLFYRLRVFPLLLPPLRDRREDVPAIAQHFLEKYSAEFGREVSGVSQPAMEILQAHDWPGNVRELENEVQRIVIQLGTDTFVKPEHVSSRLRSGEGATGRPRPTEGTLKEMMEQVERHMLKEALAAHNNNKTATAKTLGITREGLHKKLKNYGMT